MKHAKFDTVNEHGCKATWSVDGRIAGLERPDAPLRFLGAGAGPSIQCRDRNGSELAGHWLWSAKVGDAGNAQIDGVSSTLQASVEVGIDASGAAQAVWTFKNTGDVVVDTVELRDFVVVPHDVLNQVRMTIPWGAGWIMTLSRFRQGEALVVHYPIKGSMQWFSFWDEEAGLYVGTHDDKPLTKQYRIERGAAGVHFSIVWPGLELEPGESYTLPPVVVAQTDSGWEQGAGLYRAWAEATWYDRWEVPEWYQELPAWNWLPLKNQLALDVWNRAEALPERSRQAREHLGIDLIQVTAYTEGGHDTYYPDYRVGESVGGEAAFKASVKAIHDAGRRIAIYSNGRIVHAASTIAQIEGWRDWAVQVEGTKGLRPFTESYGTIVFEVMCPGCKAWRDLLLGRLAYTVSEYGVDGLYIDQIAAASAMLCRSHQHDHERPNEAWVGYMEMLRDIRASLKAINPDFYLATEGVHDMYGQYFDSLQAHTDWPMPIDDRAVNAPEVFRLTFPEMVFNMGFIPDNEIWQLRLAHLLGSGYDFGVREPQDADPAFLQTAQRVTGWRRTHAARFKSAMIDTSAASSDENYRVLGFRTDGDVYTMTGAWLGRGEPPGAIKVRAPDDVLGRRVRLLRADGVETGIDPKGGLLEFDPGGAVFLALFE